MSRVHDLVDFARAELSPAGRDRDDREPLVRGRSALEASPGRDGRGTLRRDGHRRASALRRSEGGAPAALALRRCRACSPCGDRDRRRCRLRRRKRLTRCPSHGHRRGERLEDPSHRALLSPSSARRRRAGRRFRSQDPDLRAVVLGRAHEGPLHLRWSIRRHPVPRRATKSERCVLLPFDERRLASPWVGPRHGQARARKRTVSRPPLLRQHGSRHRGRHRRDGKGPEGARSSERSPTRRGLSRSAPIRLSSRRLGARSPSEA